jgi:hypothetical protein
MDNFVLGLELIVFGRDKILDTADRLGISRPKNAGDVVYAYRYRKDMPKKIADTTTDGSAWIIIGQGDGQYAFKLSHTPFLFPNPNLRVIEIPDNTPEIIERYRLSDEQSLLSKVRYNRLIDTFLGITAYSLQNHLRTKVDSIGQIEIDEMYVGVNKKGQHYIIPVQAKGGKDRIGVVQLSQDIAFCESEFPELICVPIAVQFMVDDIIAVFHLMHEDYNAKIIDEKHYKLEDSGVFSNKFLREINRLRDDR